MYQSKYYTCEEIDERLLKGYYDDAVSNGYSGTFEQFKLELASQDIVNLDILNSHAGYTSAEAISKIAELYPTLSHTLTFIFFDKTYSRERRFKYKGSGNSSDRSSFIDNSNYVFTVGELNGDDGAINIKPLILDVIYGFSGTAFVTGSSGLYGGKLILFTDDMAHVVHQILFTSFLISDDGTKITNAHVDEKTFMYERFLNFASSTNQDREGNTVDRMAYSKWYPYDNEIQEEIVRLGETDNEIKEKLNDKTNEINVAKEEALQAISKNEQSAITNFNSQRVTPEMLSESTKQLIEASGGGTITNLADDEDLTSVDDGTGSNVLKFADKTYNANNFSGKGYKILRKNIKEVTVSKYALTITSGCTANGDITITVNSVENNISVTTDYSTPEQVASLIASSIDGSSLDGAVVSFSTQPTYNFNSTGVQGSVSDTSYIENRNVLTQSMIKETSNTIYEIRYDFDLNGEEINLDYSGRTVILNFKGGSLKNGFIRCNGQSQLIGQVKLDHIQFSGQSLQYRPFNYGNDFNLLWFYTGNIGNETINFNDVYDNFLYSLGDWKKGNYDRINLIVPSSSLYYKVTRPIYVPQWVSIDFNNATLNVQEENELNGDFVIRVNVDDTKFEQAEQYINWVVAYPQQRGFLKNLNLSGYIHKGILALDNRRYDDIRIATTINDTNFIAFDQYPEAGSRLYFDATYITRMAVGMPKDTNGNYQYGWVKLGFGDAAVLTQMIGMRLFIYNRQSFTLDGGIQCYPYAVCSIGNIRNLHNESPCAINIAFSRISFYDCIFYRKSDIQNVNIINIISNKNFELPFNVSIIGSEVTLRMQVALTFNSCIFAYNYRYSVGNYDYYDIYSDVPSGSRIFIYANNTYAVSYGYGDTNKVVYKLRYKSVKDTVSICYNKQSGYLPISNLLGLQLSVDTREKDNINGGTIVNGDTYTYYTAFSFGDRPVILRSPAVVCTANSNWNLLLLKYFNNATDTYLIRVHNGEYHILKLDLLPLFYDEYGSYTMDYGDYMNNRRKWEPYSEASFNKLVEVSNKSTVWSYNSITDSFKYSTPYPVNTQSTGITRISSLIPLNYNDKAICDGSLSWSKEESRFKGNILIDINTNLPIGVKNTGTFNQKPTSAQNIEIGFAYFCTDKQTSESESNGVMIYYKGNDVWVDALGRVVS